MPEPVVVCVLRSGGDFAPEHVTRLYNQVERVSDLHFVILTDQAIGYRPSMEERPLLRHWPGWWSKLELCAPEQDGLGDILYLDLDTTVVGNLDEIAAVGRLTMLQDFYRPSAKGSGVMYLPTAARQAMWYAWSVGGPERFMHMYHRHGDQQFFESCWNREDIASWQYLLPGQIVSYKKDVRPTSRVPPGARLVCFHGQPRPWAAPPL